jgi:crossover junction endodeoxyribonuclease RusA
MHLAVTIPVKVVSVANQRLHWAAKATQTKRQRLLAWAELKHAAPDGPGLGPVVVKLTRIAPRELDDDNLRSAFKAMRDGVADWLKVDDRDSRVKWEYAQERGAPKFYAARLEVKA